MSEMAQENSPSWFFSPSNRAWLFAIIVVLFVVAYLVSPQSPYYWPALIGIWFAGSLCFFSPILFTTRGWRDGKYVFLRLGDSKDTVSLSRDENPQLFRVAAFSQILHSLVAVLMLLLLGVVLVLYATGLLNFSSPVAIGIGFLFFSVVMVLWIGSFLLHFLIMFPFSKKQN